MNTIRDAPAKSKSSETQKRPREWTKPAFKDRRLGFECTAYALIRRKS